jgi:flagellar hook assembly protein FlgD
MYVKKSLLMCIAAVLLAAGTAPVFSRGQEEISEPTISTSLAETTYISPSASKGVRDMVYFYVTPLAAEEMVIKKYALTIRNSSGDVVYRVSDTFTKRLTIFRRLFIRMGSDRLKESVEIPNAFLWEGNADDGSALPEGEYSLEFTAVDDEGRVGTSREYTIVIDNTPPSAEIDLPYTIFSPNNDGNKDILIIEQAGTTEHAWKGTIRTTDGEVVRSYSWFDQAPANAVWDGFESDGDPAADGVYTYELSATDRAGNSFSTLVESLTIDTRDTPISLTRNVGYFSPNGDGSVDTVTFNADIPVKEGVVEWTLEVRDESGTAVWETEGKETVQESYTYDGKDSNGRTLPEGTYTGFFSVLYSNGNNPTAESPSFIVDLTPPSATVNLQPTVFSPNGDGKKDILYLYQETTDSDVWTGEVRDADDKTVLSIAWRGKAKAQIEWDGTDADGTVVDDGEYSYVLYTTDRAGNYAQSPIRKFTLDTRITPVSLSVDKTVFSPNGDNIQDTLTISPIVEDPEGLERLIVRILDAENTVVRTFNRDALLAPIVWEGKLPSQRFAPDGGYTVTADFVYRHGNEPSAKVGPITIDTAFPQATVSTSSTIFSPDDDGSKDTIRIVQTESSEERTWTGRIFDPENSIVRKLTWTGRVDSFVWDGKDDQGNRLPDGIYTYELTSTDPAGNKSVFTIPEITIDTRPTPVTVAIDTSAFSPNGDDLLDTLTFSPRLEVTEGVVSWTLAILGSNKTPRRTFEGTGNVPNAIEFDGRGSAGGVVSEGEYRGLLTVTYRNGNKPEAKSPPFTVDITPPTAKVSADDPIFSPNSDGKKDTITIGQQGSRELEWKGAILDSAGRTVRTYSWYNALPSSTIWNGRDDDGRLVKDGTYSYYVFAQDKAGNKGASGKISIEKDTKMTPISIRANTAAFSPNGDGVKDQISLQPEVGVTAGMESYKVYVVDNNGRTVWERTGFSYVPERIDWNGLDSTGTVMPDGSYSALFEAVYQNGNAPTAKSGPFLVDTTPPRISLSAEYLLFSPDGDGRRDGVVMEQESTEEELWEAAVLNDEGMEVRSAFWKGRVEDFDWDGRDDQGSVVSDGEYTYTVSSTDAAGNSAELRLPGITVDTRIASGYVSISDIAISPNGDGILDAARINLYKSLSEGIISWKVSMLEKETENVVYEFGGTGNTPIPSYLVWDGRRRNGNPVDGEYIARLAIDYEKGNQVRTDSSTPLVVDTTPPQFSFTMKPVPFSPDDDNVDDTITFSFSEIEDATQIGRASCRERV